MARRKATRKGVRATRGAMGVAADDCRVCGVQRAQNTTPDLTNEWSAFAPPCRGPERDITAEVVASSRGKAGFDQGDRN